MEVRNRPGRRLAYRLFYTEEDGDPFDEAASIESQVIVGRIQAKVKEAQSSLPPETTDSDRALAVTAALTPEDVVVTHWLSIQQAKMASAFIEALKKAAEGGEAEAEDE